MYLQRQRDKGDLQRQRQGNGSLAAAVGQRSGWMKGLAVEPTNPASTNALGKHLPAR